MAIPKFHFAFDILECWLYLPKHPRPSSGILAPTHVLVMTVATDVVLGQTNHDFCEAQKQVTSVFFRPLDLP